MDVIEALKSRKSIRGFKKDTVAKATIQAFVERPYGFHYRELRNGNVELHSLASCWCICIGRDILHRFAASHSYQ
jgi:hypothetical protein